MHVGSAKSLDCFMCLIYSSFIDIVLLPNRYCMKFNSADTKNINTYVYIYISYIVVKKGFRAPHTCLVQKKSPSVSGCSVPGIQEFCLFSCKNNKQTKKYCFSDAGKTFAGKYFMTITRNVRKFKGVQNLLPTTAFVEKKCIRCSFSTQTVAVTAS